MCMSLFDTGGIYIWAWDDLIADLLQWLCIGYDLFWYENIYLSQ